MKTDTQFHAVGPMIGTTRSRVSFFMNRFRRWGFIDYPAGGAVQVDSSLLNIESCIEPGAN
jgi:CRP/FNR family transcriptional regulator, cyclic AMP receptor protein